MATNHTQTLYFDMWNNLIAYNSEQSTSSSEDEDRTDVHTAKDLSATIMTKQGVEEQIKKCFEEERKTGYQYMFKQIQE